MKKALVLLLVLSALITVFAAFPANSAQAVDEKPVISWFVSGMTVGEAQELSPAVDTVMRDGSALSPDKTIATGDTVITENGEYTAWVLGDVAGNGEVDKYGYILIKRYCMDTYELSESEFFCADMTRDGKVDAYDYILAKRVCMGTYKIPLPENSTGVPVLLYHHILTDAERDTSQWRGNEITIATSEFRRHMEMIRDGGYNVVTADQVVAYVRGEILLPQKSIVLTFDDGYKSNTYYAAPILQEFGYKATMFSIMVCYDEEYQPWYDPTALQHVTRQDLAPYAEVLDQQCHTWANHNQLSQQSYSQIYNDLMLSQNCEKYDYFAYPYGDYDDEVIRAVKDAGFTAAFNTERLDAVPGDNIYEIPRYTVTSPLTDEEFKALLANAD